MHFDPAEGSDRVRAIHGREQFAAYPPVSSSVQETGMALPQDLDRAAGNRERLWDAEMGKGLGSDIHNQGAAMGGRFESEVRTEDKPERE